MGYLIMILLLPGILPAIFITYLIDKFEKPRYRNGKMEEFFGICFICAAIFYLIGAGLLIWKFL